MIHFFTYFLGDDLWSGLFFTDAESHLVHCTLNLCIYCVDGYAGRTLCLVSNVCIYIGYSGRNLMHTCALGLGEISREDLNFKI